MNIIKFGLSVLAFAVVANNALAETPRFKTLECRAEAWHNNTFSVKASPKALVISEGNHAGGDLLKSLLTKVPGNLFRAYRCFDYQLTIPTAGCDFDRQHPERFRCTPESESAKAKLKVRALADTCGWNNEKHADYYEFEVKNWKVALDHKDSKDDYDSKVRALVLDAKLLAVSDAGKKTKGSMGAAHYLGYWRPADGCCDLNPSCKLDGELLFR